jgi:hypothetical protein
MKAQRSKDHGARDRGTRPAAAIFLSGLLYLSSVLLSFGQSSPPRRVWGLALGGLFPMGEFNSRIGKDAVGVSAFYAWRIRNAPVLFGVEAAAHIYPQSLFKSDSDSYNMVDQGLVFLRLQPRAGSVVTYLEVLAGVNYLSTSSVYYDDYSGEYESEVEFQDITVAAGAGAGLCMQLGRGAKSMDPDGKPTYLDFKVRYVFGGYANYMREVWDGSLSPEHSRTNVLTVQLGLSWFF